jgi:hypothetical protein
MRGALLLVSASVEIHSHSCTVMVRLAASAGSRFKGMRLMLSQRWGCLSRMWKNSEYFQKVGCCRVSGSAGQRVQWTGMFVEGCRMVGLAALASLNSNLRSQLDTIVFFLVSVFSVVVHVERPQKPQPWNGSA